MGANNNLTTLNGLFKEVYADKLENLIPDGTKMLNAIPFVSRDKQQGGNYHQPVVLGLEHGVTYSSGADAFSLNSAIAGQIKDATVSGCQMVLRSIISYAAASRATGKGPQAFEDATKFLIGNMMRSVARKLEIELFYGGMGIGQITAAGSSGTTLKITTAEWAPGIWAGAENMGIAIYRATSDVLDTTVTSVDFTAQTITVASVSGYVATDGDVVYVAGAYGNEFQGLHSIMSTTSGTLFGINVGTYNLFKSNQYSAGSAALSVTKILSAASHGVEKGLDSDAKCWVNPRSWQDVVNSELSKRMYDESYKPGQLEEGMKSLTLYGQNGVITIEPSIFVKQGYAFLVPMDELVRVGSTDITFKRAHDNNEFFRDLETAAGYELRCYTDQALFCSAPGKCVLITGIVNSA